MDITYLGHSSFKLRGKGATVVTDPYGSSIGLSFPKHVEADIVTVSHDHEDHNALRLVEGNPFIVTGPGEYEIKGVGVVGLGVGKNTIYRIEIDGLSVVHLGDLGHELSSADVDSLDGVDILLVPVGGVYTIDASTAAKVVGEIEPTIVIPMHYNRPGLDQKTFAELAPVDAFLKEMGKTDVSPQPKCSVTRDKLPEEMQVIVLE